MAKSTEKQKTKGRVRALWYEHKAAVIIIGAVVTIVTSVSAAVVVKTFEGWRAPKKFAAKFESTPRVESNVVLKGSLEESGIPTSGYTEQQLAQAGHLVRFQLQLEGFEGRTCSVRWEVFDAETKRRQEFADWNRIQNVVDMTPEGATDVGSAHFWVPPAAGDKPFFVRLIVCDDQGTDLTFIDTDVVRVRPEPQASVSPNVAATPP